MPRSRASSSCADFRIEGEHVFFSGVWDLPRLGDIEGRLQGLSWPEGSAVCFDLGQLQAMDTAGAWLLRRTLVELEKGGVRVEVRDAPPQAASLLHLVEPLSGVVGGPAPVARESPLVRLGRDALRRVSESFAFLSFMGRVAVEFFALLARPTRIRWPLVLTALEHAGYRALPIVGLLAFLLGVVTAYQGGVQLQKYGATLFVADLVGLSMLRELAPLLTAIIVAGRTGSAFTAQIGTMKVTEEIDALRTMGISPIEQLVIPKVIALLIALPLLTVFADIMGLLGGIVIAGFAFDVGWESFITRVGNFVSVHSYLIGIGKAPVFASIIAAVGCFQGFQVRESAESVGHHTTRSVVQAIFLVIVVDAAFSVAFSKVGFTR